MDRISVAFEGDGAGVGGLTWGQQQVWSAMSRLRSSLPMGGVVPVTDGRTVDDIVEELRSFMSRYAAMRMLLRFGDDGTVTQESFASGETVLRLLDTAGDDDPRAAADRLEAEWRAREFDYANEWPLRMAAVRHDGVLTHVVAIMSHHATDLGGLSVMLRDLRSRPTPPPVGIAPVELWRRQREPAMRRHTDKAMRYWESLLRTMPARRLPDPVDRGEPLYCRIVRTSPAMHLAAEALSSRVGADPAWVLLAAFAVATQRVIGSSPFVAQAVIGNRFRPGLADAVSTMTQDGLCLLDVAGASADEAIARARVASMRTSKYAYYDPKARLALIDQVQQDRGEVLDLGCCLYNDRRMVTRTGTGPAPAGAIRAALGASRAVEVVMRSFGGKLMVNVDDVPHTVQLTVEFNTRYLSIPDVHALLAEMESFTVEAALTAAPA